MLRISWWNTQKVPCAVMVPSVDLLPDGTLQYDRNGKVIWKLKADGREGTVVIDWLVD